MWILMFVCTLQLTLTCTSKRLESRLFLVLGRVHSIDYPSFPGAGDVWLSLRGTAYQSNSCVALEDIGENDSALLCMTNLTSCCTSMTGSASGDWFFPNGTRIPNGTSCCQSLDEGNCFFSNGTRVKTKEDLYTTRGASVVRLHRRRGGVEGIYRCEILDSVNVTQTMYIGVHTTSSGECTLLFCSTIIVLQCIKVEEE